MAKTGKAPELKQTSFLNMLDPANADRREANPTRWEARKNVSPPVFNGPGYVAEFDEARLKGQAQAVYNLMRDGVFRTLDEIHSATGIGSQTGISATLRSFRKKQYGRHIVNRRRRGDPKSGLWEYQLLPNFGSHKQ